MKAVACWRCTLSRSTLRLSRAGSLSRDQPQFITGFGIVPQCQALAQLVHNSAQQINRPSELLHISASGFPDARAKRAINPGTANGGLKLLDAETASPGGVT